MVEDKERIFLILLMLPLSTLFYLRYARNIKKCASKSKVKFNRIVLIFFIQLCTEKTNVKQISSK